MTRAASQPVDYTLRLADEADRVYCRDLIFAAVGHYWRADPGVDPLERHHHRFAEEWPDDVRPSSRLILADNASVGLLTVYPLPERTFVRYLLLEPAWRGRGLGAAVLRRVIADALPLPVELKVDRANTRAQRFYERLDFRVVESADTYHLLRHTPMS